MIRWNVSPNRTRVTVRFRPLREKKRIKDQRGWLVLNAARRQVIVASGPMMQAFPLSGSPVRPNDIAQEPKFLPRSSVRNGNSGDMNQNCIGFNRTGRRRGSCGVGAARPPRSPTARTSGRAAARCS
jgi:hypothetical protein